MQCYAIGRSSYPCTALQKSQMQRPTLKAGQLIVGKAELCDCAATLQSWREPLNLVATGIHTADAERQTE